jgi:DNA repair protein NreA
MDVDQPRVPAVVDPRGKTRDELIASIPPELCVRCKGGKLLCGLARCPILESIHDKMPRSARTLRGKELQGPSPPTLFIGRHGYPAVQAGPMLLPGAPLAPSQADDPTAWIGQRSMEDIVAMRASLVRSRQVVRVDRPRARNPLLEAAQLLAMASKPAEVEVTLRKDANQRLQPQVDGIAAPMGPGLDAERARVVDNPVVPRKVDALVGDVHALASDAVQELYRGGIGAYHIQRVLSAGLLGQEQRRRLVPTRWSITATDDILGKQLTARVSGFQSIGQPEVYRSEHYGNRFWVLLMPRPWAYEMLEAWHQGSAWSRGGDAASQDWEPWEGRTTYAGNVSGAYYAAKLSILEHLVQRQRSAQPLVYREITDAYLFPLGVWVIREGVRDAMAQGGRACDSLEAAVRTISMECGRPHWHGQSVLLREARVQRRITEYA